MPQPRPWIEEIVEALGDLNGQAAYTDLYRRIYERGQMDFDLNPNWQSAVRRTIQAASSDSITFNPKNGDIFYSVNGLGGGTWGLRSSVGETPVPFDNVDLIQKTPQPAPRVLQTTYRRLRDTKTARTLKASYDNRCQICGTQVRTGSSDFYSEAHHIQPLGKDGPDVKENLIVLCPNHHAEFDYGGIALDPETKRVIHLDSANRYHNQTITLYHDLGTTHLTFHLQNIFGNMTDQVDTDF